MLFVQPVYGLRENSKQYVLLESKLNAYQEGGVLGGSNSGKMASPLRTKTGGDDEGNYWCLEKKAKTPEHLGWVSNPGALKTTYFQDCFRAWVTSSDQREICGSVG